MAIQVLVLSGRLDDAKSALDSARKVGDRRDPTFAIDQQANFASGAGRLREAQTLRLQSRALDSARGQVQPLVFAIGGDIIERADAGLPVDEQLKAFDAAVAAINVDSMPATDRPYAFFTRVNAKAGRLDGAKTELNRFNAAMSDTALRRVNQPSLQRVQAELAEAEHRWSDAADLYRKSDRLPDGPSNSNPAGVSLALARMFAQAGMADSVIAQYESYLKTPWGSRARQGPDVAVDAPLTEALAKTYDSKGDVAQATKLYRDFIELWKNADPELQPRVAAARARLKELGQVEKPR